MRYKKKNIFIHFKNKKLFLSLGKDEWKLDFKYIKIFRPKYTNETYLTKIYRQTPFKCSSNSILRVSWISYKSIWAFSENHH